MAYVTAQARQELLDAIAEAIDRIAVALAAFGEAYEHLDEHSADTLEEQLFRPAQTAYGRAKATHTAFATRHGLPVRTFAPASVPPVSHNVQSTVEDAVEALADADDALATLQDSLKPVEVGDPELRAGLAEVRRLLGAVPAAATRFLRGVGR